MPDILIGQLIHPISSAIHAISQGTLLSTIVVAAACIISFMLMKFFMMREESVYTLFRKRISPIRNSLLFFILPMLASMTVSSIDTPVARQIQFGLVLLPAGISMGGFLCFSLSRPIPFTLKPRWFIYGVCGSIVAASVVTKGVTRGIGEASWFLAVVMLFEGFIALRDRNNFIVAEMKEFTVRIFERLRANCFQSSLLIPEGWEGVVWAIVIERFTAGRINICNIPELLGELTAKIGNHPQSGDAISLWGMQYRLLDEYSPTFESFRDATVVRRLLEESGCVTPTRCGEETDISNRAVSG